MATTTNAAPSATPAPVVTDQDKGNTGSDINFKSLVQQSETFQKLKEELCIAVKLSLTGITNLVVGHEDPCLVDGFLKDCFKMQDLYNNTIDIDSVELQRGAPGKGHSTQFLDELIYGRFEVEDDDQGLGIPVFKTDPQTGKRKRKPDGFVNRREVLKAQFKDKLLIIKNLDYCLDFCKEKPGEVDPRALYILDNFRNPSIKKGCRLLLVTNKKLDLPFKVRTVEINPVDAFEANHIIDSFVDLYKNGKYEVNLSKGQREQIARKLTGLTYTEAGDALASAISRSENPPQSKKIDCTKVMRLLREAINRSFMDKGFGLTQLTPRPWEDYICPESSNFTFDVEKLMRDFNEVKRLRALVEQAIKSGHDDTEYIDQIECVQNRMPHVFVLHGKGGVGKCLGRGTQVMMFDGKIKNVEDVVTGDLLMGPDSTSRTVLSTTSGVGPLYRVDQKNGDSYVCNDKHILSLQNAQKSSDRKPIFISAEDFYKKNKNWKKYNNGWKVGVEFQEQNLPIDPYWFGLWLGDGTSLKPAITVANKDPEICSWLESWAKENSLFIRKEVSEGASAWNFSPRHGSGYCVNDIKASLINLNVLGNKHIPEVYWKNSSKNRLALLAGLLDSDGYMTKTGSLQFTNVNKRLAIEVLHLVRSLGLKGFWCEGIKGIKKINYTVMAYTVTIGGDLSRIPTKLPRKMGHNNPQKKSLKCGISVTPIGNGEYFGFTIDGDKQFLLGDFTVTHNSAFPIHLAGLLDFDVWDFNINAVHSMWVGEGPRQARESIKCVMGSTHVIIRVDEYDRGIGATGETGQGMHEAHKQVESEFMGWLQNAQEEKLFAKKNIFVVLTTNHKENITGPLLRSGRADLVIDIDNFDAESMKATLKTTARRMHNRGVKVLGFKTQEELQEAINSLDLDNISELCTMKGFTVRDVEMLISEMAAHYYYKKIGQEGLPWDSKTFIEVLEQSQGSIRDESTGELALGDRYVVQAKKGKKKEEKKLEGLEGQYNPEEFKNAKGFKEV